MIRSTSPLNNNNQIDMDTWTVNSWCKQDDTDDADTKHVTVVDHAVIPINNHERQHDYDEKEEKMVVFQDICLNKEGDDDVFQYMTSCGSPSLTSSPSPPSSLIMEHDDSSPTTDSAPSHLSNTDVVHPLSKKVYLSSLWLTTNMNEKKTYHNDDDDEDIIDKGIPTTMTSSPTISISYSDVTNSPHNNVVTPIKYNGKNDVINNDDEKITKISLYNNIDKNCTSHMTHHNHNDSTNRNNKKKTWFDSHYYLVVGLVTLCFIMLLMIFIFVILTWVNVVNNGGPSTSSSIVNDDSSYNNNINTTNSSLDNTPISTPTISPSIYSIPNSTNNNTNNSTGNDINKNQSCPIYDLIPPKLSGKRGVARTLRLIENLQGVIDLNPYWNYNWGPIRIDEQPNDIEFIPMIWGDGKNTHESWDHITQSIEEHILPYIVNGTTTHLLGFNEPDRVEQANMTVQQAIKLWPLLESYNVSLVSPSGAAPLGDWMKEFMYLAKQLCYRIDYIGVHWYGGISFNGFVNDMTKIYNEYGNIPLMITEFASADWTARDTNFSRHNKTEVLEFMKQVLPWLEEQDWISGYAWFSFPYNSTIGSSSSLYTEDGQLTKVGQYYASVTNENRYGNQSITIWP